MNLTAGLHIGIEALANLIPGAELAADVAMLADLARTISEYRSSQSKPRRPLILSRTHLTICRTCKFLAITRNFRVMMHSLKASQVRDLCQSISVQLVTALNTITSLRRGSQFGC